MSPWRLVHLAFALAAALPGCAGSAPPPEGSTAIAELDRDGAQRILGGMIAADRARAGLAPVAWDEAAGRAARAHVDDMASRGFAAHVGSDGSVPEERATRAGVGRAVMENVGCIADARPRPLVAEPRFSRREIEALHAAFMDEAPPYDGHRRNVLGPTHGGFGLALARAEGAARPCIVVLFVARDGKLDPIPAEATLGQVLTVSGYVTPPNAAVYVSAARLPPRGRPSAADLNRTGAYTPPSPYAAVAVEAEPSAPGAFRARIVLDDQRQPGTYAIGAWARIAGSAQPVLVGLRTLVVR